MASIIHKNLYLIFVLLFYWLADIKKNTIFTIYGLNRNEHFLINIEMFSKLKKNVFHSSY